MTLHCMSLMPVWCMAQSASCLMQPAREARIGMIRHRYLKSAHTSQESCVRHGILEDFSLSGIFKKSLNRPKLQPIIIP